MGASLDITKKCIELMIELRQYPDGSENMWVLVDSLLAKKVTMNSQVIYALLRVAALTPMSNCWTTPGMAKDVTETVMWTTTEALGDDNDAMEQEDDGDAKTKAGTPCLSKAKSVDPKHPRLRDLDLCLADKLKFLLDFIVNYLLPRCGAAPADESQDMLLSVSESIAVLAEKQLAVLDERPPELVSLIRITRTLIAALSNLPLSEHFEAFNFCAAAYQNREDSWEANIIAALLAASQWFRGRILHLLKNAASMKHAVDNLEVHGKMIKENLFIKDAVTFSTTFDGAITCLNTASAVLRPGATSKFEVDLIQLLITSRDEMVAEAS